MKIPSFVYMLGGFAVGVFLMYLTVVRSNDAKITNLNAQMMNNQSATTQHTSMMGTGKSMSMQDMMTGLQGKTGDDFDKTFISEMIMHHQGAIDMAKLAQQDAKHDEIKSLANNIIAAQTKEIMGMQGWQKAWGYTQ